MSSKTSSPAHVGRIVSLDILRGIAILMVLIVHAPWPAWLIDGPTGRVIGVGAYGVDLFFVLSGYLISRLLFAELQRSGKIVLTRFWLRRGFKIWPSYYVAYLLAAIVTGWTTTFAWPDLLAWPNFVFLQNYVQTQSRWFASWSLAVEEHFYTTLPLVLLAFMSLRRSIKHLPIFLLGVCLAAPVFRYLTEDTALIWIQTHLRMDALCWGVLLGYCQHREIEWPFRFLRQRPFVSGLLAICTAAIVISFPYTHKVGHTVGFTLVALCSTILTGDAVRNPDWSADCGRRLSRVLVWSSHVGVYSYTIYLVQQLTKALIDASKNLPVTSIVMNSHVPQVGAFILGSIGIGYVLAVVVERPFLEIRNRVAPSK